MKTKRPDTLDPEQQAEIKRLNYGFRRHILSNEEMVALAKKVALKPPTEEDLEVEREEVRTAHKYYPV